MVPTNQSPRFIDALRAPADVFEHPRHVLAVEHWSAAKKRAVIELWRRDVERRAERGDDAGAHAELEAVTEVEARLDAALAGQTRPATGPHKVAGVCESREHAQRTFDMLLAADFDAQAVKLIGPSEVERLDAPRGDLVADAARKVASGAAVGVVGALSVAAIVAVPPLPALAAAAASGLVGSGVGAAAALALSDGDFRDLAVEALHDGAWLVIAEAAGEAQALEAQAVVAGSPAVRSIDQSGAVRDERAATC